MKKLFILSFVFALYHFNAQSQGCVAIRSITGFGQFMTPEFGQEPVKWVANVNTRYFKSYQEFDGTNNLNVPKEDQKVNHIFVLDFSITRMLNKGWSITFDLPITAANRTSWQEHGNNPASKIKYTTSTFGLSDIRVTVSKWLFDVSTLHKGNAQFGLGLKLPTGDYGYQDYFYKADGIKIKPVNQSIQLGDGGTGISLELNSYYTINKTVSLYANAFYLFNPRDQNGVDSGFYPDSVSLVILSGGNVNSVPDVYTARAGANFTAKKFIMWAGIRIEGQPVYDLIGASNGNRRPGKIISVEPGLNYKLKDFTLFAFVPFPIYRETMQSVPDQKLDELNKTKYHSSTGGFSDYMIFMGVFFKL